MKMKFEPYVVMVSSDQHGKSLSIYSEGLDISFQIPVNDEIFNALKGGD